MEDFLSVQYFPCGHVSKEEEQVVRKLAPKQLAAHKAGRIVNDVTLSSEVCPSCHTDWVDDFEAHFD